MDTLSPLAALVEKLKGLLDNRATLETIRAALAANIEKEQFIMSQITDWAAKEAADLATVSGTLDNIVAGIAALNALIEAFQNSPGTLSQADQAALDEIQTASNALVVKSGAISVNPPTPPGFAPAAHR